MQRYEGASTIYGPHTLTLYLNVYTQLAKALAKDERVNAGPTPPDFSRKLISFIPKVYFDTAGFRKFGRCISQPQPQVNRGDIVEAKFVAGNPRNNVMHGKTFLAIEKLNDSGDWTVVATDADWETKFIWKRTSFWLGKSEVTIQWEIGEDVPIGTYRIRHFGHNKSVFGGVHPYEGASDSFQVV